MISNSQRPYHAWIRKGTELTFRPRGSPGWMMNDIGTPPTNARTVNREEETCN